MAHPPHFFVSFIVYCREQSLNASSNNHDVIIFSAVAKVTKATLAVYSHEYSRKPY
jgi:hypothetical protein